jgi:hypothetical protein
MAISGPQTPMRVGLFQSTDLDERLSQLSIIRKKGISLDLVYLPKKFSIPE